MEGGGDGRARGYVGGRREGEMEGGGGLMEWWVVVVIVVRDRLDTNLLAV